MYEKVLQVFQERKELNLFYNIKQLNYLILPTQKIKFHYQANRQ